MSVPYLCASLHALTTGLLRSSKDALIRVWDRETLELRSTLRGHEGPVNAVGLQGNRVVSASGDGKMILWDVASGERLRTFEGHDRGLACIEFKVGFALLVPKFNCQLTYMCNRMTSSYPAPTTARSKSGTPTPAHVFAHSSGTTTWSALLPSTRAVGGS